MSERAQLNTLHKAYVDCCQQSVTAFLQNKDLSQQAEFCPTEKQAYFDHMRAHMPTEFSNIQSIEKFSFTH